MVFTIGNLITLGIVVCVLILYRLSDKNNRPLEKVKKYAEKCKEEIAAYAEEKSMAVKNFGIDLDIEKKAAVQLMKNIQKLTEEDLAKKSESILRIEEHIKAFESSLEELFGMTDRVQENLSRIRDESAFVENTGKKVNEAKEKFEQIERAFIIAGKNLEEAEIRLERKNSETLEQTANNVIISAKSMIADFETTAQVIERKVEEHREAVIKTEREREAILNRDLETVKKMLKEVMENAGKRADKMEEAALLKLKEQAQERVNQIKASFEEKIKTTQETLKTEHGSIQEKLKTIHDKWNAEFLDISAKQKNYHQEWTKNTAELAMMSKKQKEDISISIAKQQEEVNAALTKERDTINSSLMQQQNDWKQNFQEFNKVVEKQRKEMDISITTTKNDLNQSLAELKTKSTTALKQQQDELGAVINEVREKSGAAVKTQLEELNTVIGEVKQKSAAAIKQQQEEIFSTHNSQKQEFNNMLSDFSSSAGALREKLETAVKQQHDELTSAISELKEKSGTAVKQQNNDLNLALSELKKNTDTAVMQQQNELSSTLGELKKNTDTAVMQQQNELSSALGELKKNTDTAVMQQQNELSSALGELRKNTDTAVRQQQTELSSALGELKKNTDTAVRQQQNELSSTLGELKKNTDTAVRQQQNELSSTLGELKEKTFTAVKQQNDELNIVISEIKSKTGIAIAAQHDDINASMEKQLETWKTMCINTEKDLVTAIEKRLEGYSKIHTEAINQLNHLTDDAARLDAELRKAMGEAVSRVRGDFSAFEKETGSNMETATAEFNAQAKVLRNELEEMNKELNGIRQQAYDNVSEKLSAFENEFTADLGKRSSELSRLIADWQESLELRIENNTSSIHNEWHKAQENITFEHRKDLAALGEKLTSDLERLKHETSALEEGIREEMKTVDETRSSFAEQLSKDLAEIRGTAKNELETQIGQYQLSMQQTLRQKQRELEKEVEELSTRVQGAYAALDNAAFTSRQNFDEWQTQFNASMREMDTSFEELRRRNRETAAENDERISHFRLGLDDIRKELDGQKKIFDLTGERKQELERRIEEINGNIDRLEQRKNEIAQLESQFTRIKRLEDEVNNKMTRFLNEKSRIEQMENNFNNLIKTSQSVKERLDHVSSSDDILQAVQVQIRKLEDSIKETEDKFQRVERKKEVLDETSEGIDRNFKALQKTENAIKNASDIITVLTTQFDNLRSSIEMLAAENIKATDAVEKVSTLDDTLSQIEKRITEMNVAREWLARTETELKTLDKNMRSQLKIFKDAIDKEGGKVVPVAARGALTPLDRDNVKRLKGQGWKNEEIASTMGMSINEVELILEISSRD